MQQYKSKYKHLRDLYNNTDKDIIKYNLINILKSHNIKPNELHNILEMSIHSIYSYFKRDKGNIPELINLLIISEVLKIDIIEFFTSPGE